MTDKQRIHWLFIHFMKMMARAERAEEENTKLRSLFHSSEAKRAVRDELNRLRKISKRK